MCFGAEVSRHAARVIFLEYTGEGPIDTTLMLVGKVCMWQNLMHDCPFKHFVSECILKAYTVGVD